MLKPIAFPRTRDRRLAALLSVLNTLRDDLSAEYGPVEANILFLGDGFCECRVRPAQPTAKMAGKNSPGKNAEGAEGAKYFHFCLHFFHVSVKISNWHILALRKTQRHTSKRR